MINVTERARQELKRILITNADMSQARLRLIDRGRGKLGIGVDIEMPGDKLVEYEGSTVLVVERRLAVGLAGVILDVDDTVEGPEIVICYELENIANTKNE